MSRIPNPFLSGEAAPKQPDVPSGPGFLMMTRPPSAFHPRPWRGSSTPTHRHALPPGFIPFSSGGHGGQDSPRLRGRGGRFNHGRGPNTPRNCSPYQPPYRGGGAGDWSIGQHSPHQPSPRPSRDWSMAFPVRFPSTPTSSGNRHFNKFSSNDNSKRPSDFNSIDEFVTPKMVSDPWAHFHLPTPAMPDPLRKTSTITSRLDDSKIIVDADTGVIVNSYQAAASATEGDSSPVADTGTKLDGDK